MSSVSDTLKDLIKDWFGLNDEDLKPKVSPAPQAVIKASVGTASHEAAHALLAWCCTHIESVEHVEMLTTVTGFTRHKPAEPVQHDGAWGLVVIILAGLAGQGLAMSAFNIKESEQDLMTARLIAERLVAEGKDQDTPWPDIPPDTTKTDISAFYKSRPTKRAAAVLNLCYRKARHVIRERRPAFDRLSVELMARGKIDKSGLEAILGPRRVFLLRARQRPIFV